MGQPSSAEAEGHREQSDFTIVSREDLERGEGESLAVLRRGQVNDEVVEQTAGRFAAEQPDLREVSAIDAVLIVGDDEPESDRVIERALFMAGIAVGAINDSERAAANGAFTRVSDRSLRGHAEEMVRRDDVSTPDEATRELEVSLFMQYQPELARALTRVAEELAGGGEAADLRDRYMWVAARAASRLHDEQVVVATEQRVFGQSDRQREVADMVAWEGELAEESEHGESGAELDRAVEELSRVVVARTSLLPGSAEGGLSMALIGPEDQPVTGLVVGQVASVEAAPGEPTHRVVVRYELRPTERGRIVEGPFRGIEPGIYEVEVGPGEDGRPVWTVVGSGDEFGELEVRTEAYSAEAFEALTEIVARAADPEMVADSSGYTEVDGSTLQSYVVPTEPAEVRALIDGFGRRQPALAWLLDGEGLQDRLVRVEDLELGAAVVEELIYQQRALDAALSDGQVPEQRSVAYLDRRQPWNVSKRLVDMWYQMSPNEAEVRGEQPLMAFYQRFREHQPALYEYMVRWLTGRMTNRADSMAERPSTDEQQEAILDALLVVAMTAEAIRRHERDS